MASSSSWNLTEATKAVHDITVNGYSATKAAGSRGFSSKRLTVGGYEWEIHYAPQAVNFCGAAFRLAFLGATRTPHVRASLSCGLMEPSTSSVAHWLDASGMRHMCEEKVVSTSFYMTTQCTRWAELMRQDDLERNSNILANDSFRGESLSPHRQAANGDAVAPNLDPHGCYKGNPRLRGERLLRHHGRRQRRRLPLWATHRGGLRVGDPLPLEAELKAAGHWHVAFKLGFLEPERAGGVKASLGCQLTDPVFLGFDSTVYWRDASGQRHECKEQAVSH
uniref:MATH domain-containing protein n=1 Tax=Oryza brachyantha TaxID=4533 RepID=J3MGQ1_ORYBR